MSNDAAILARAILPSCGACRICGCEGDSCSLEAGEKCCWMNDLRTLCSNPRCVMADSINRRREARDACRRRVKRVKGSKGRAA